MEVKNVLDTFRAFGGETSYCILTLIAILYIWCSMKEIHRKKFLWAVVCLFILCYNNVSQKMIAKIGGGDIYYRFFWILSMTITISIALCYVMQKYDKTKVKKWGILVMLLLICSFGGKSFLQKNSLNLPDNAYKISDEIIIISNVIHEDAGTNDEINLLVDHDMMVSLRQYDSSLRFVLGLDAYRGLLNLSEEHNIMYEVVVNKNYNEIAQKDFQRVVKNNGVQYLVVEYSEGLNAYLTDCGMTGLAPVGIYGIYRVD